MRNLFKRLRSGPTDQTLPPPKPEQPTYIIGDIHGCLDALDRLMGMIIDTNAGQPAALVFVGDYIDRGSDSAGVLKRLQQIEGGGDFQVTCLLGNHERMMLNFINDPLKYGDIWLNNGGIETLSSFQIPRVEAGDETDRLRMLAEALVVTIGAETLAWLHQRPLYWISGTLAVVHAYADPNTAIHAQPEKTLLWSRPAKNSHPRPDDIWVAHGHTITSEPSCENGYIAVDTGAYARGILTCAICDGASVRFLST